MKRKILLAALLAIVMIGLCGCETASPIVGKWETGDSDHIVNYEFTADHRVILDQRLDDGTWQRLECSYELKEGRLLRSGYESDADGCTEDQVPVIFHINGDELTLEALSHLGQSQYHRVDAFTCSNPAFP